MRQAQSRPRHQLRRLCAALAIPLILVTPATTLAGGACGNAASGWVRVSYVEWWDKTVEVGFDGDLASAIVTLAPLVGTAATESAVRRAVIDGIVGVDANGNGALCWKRLPTTPGLPSFVFNAVDDAATSPGG